jgi:hypothetical protein
MVVAAEQKHIAEMVTISEAKRQQYQSLSPVFWRKAADSAQRHAEYLETLITQPVITALVSEVGDGINGFIIGRVVSAPPVYDPGGLVCMVDDFALSHSADWPTVGERLLSELEARVKGNGVVLIVTVCGAGDIPKRSMLQARGATVSSEWYVSKV